jgi:hypothetical protein
MTATPMTPVPRPPLDDRVMANGQPVSRLTVKRHKYGGWFVIRRAEGPEGVVLEIRIPGNHDDRPYDGQASAVIAADEIYIEYTQAVNRLMGRQETA